MSGTDIPPWVAAQYGSPVRRPPGRERSPRRPGEDPAGQLFAPGWAAAQQQMPVPIAINTPGMTQAQQQVTEAAVTQLAAGVLGGEERLARLEAHAEHVAPSLTNLEARTQGLASTMQSPHGYHGENGRGICQHDDAGHRHAVEFGCVQKPNDS